MLEFIFFPGKADVRLPSFPVRVTLGDRLMRRSTERCPASERTGRRLADSREYCLACNEKKKSAKALKKSCPEKVLFIFHRSARRSRARSPGIVRGWAAQAKFALRRSPRGSARKKAGASSAAAALFTPSLFYSSKFACKAQRTARRASKTVKFESRAGGRAALACFDAFYRANARDSCVD